MPDAPEFDSVPEAFRVPYAWVDGEVVPSEQAMVPLMTHTLHYGLGAFEGIRGYDGELGPAVFRLQEHIARLFRSARLIRLEVPFTEEQVCAACLETLAKNGLRVGYLRPIVFVDDGKRGLNAPRNRVRVAIAVWPWGAYLGEEGIKNGIRAQVSSWARMSPTSLLPKGKICGQYVNSVLAKRDAMLAGYDEAILLDQEGFVAEASGENLFIVENGKLVTPPKAAPILEGITRDSVITLAKGLGYDVSAGWISRDRLFCADEVFMTGTAAEVTPVREVDGRPIGSGGRGPVTEKLQSTYMDAVQGRLEAYHGWLSPYEVPA